MKLPHHGSAIKAVWLLLLALGSGACSSLSHNLRTRFSNEYRCEFEHTSLTKLGAGAVRVSGCGREVTYLCIRSGTTGFRSCIQEGASELAAAPLAAAPVVVAPVAAPSEPVVGQGIDAEGNPTLRATTSLEAGELLLLAQPKTHAGAILLTVQAQYVLGQARDACSLELLVNGQKRDLGKLGQRLGAKTEELSVQVPIEVLTDLAQAERVAGRICDLRFLLSAENKAVLREFVTRYQEEMSWDAPAAANAQPALAPGPASTAQGL